MKEIIAKVIFPSSSKNENRAKISNGEAHSFDLISISVGVKTFGDANFFKSNFKASSECLMSTSCSKTH